MNKRIYYTICRVPLIGRRVERVCSPMISSVFVAECPEFMEYVRDWMKKNPNKALTKTVFNRLTKEYYSTH